MNKTVLIVGVGVVVGLAAAWLLLSDSARTLPRSLQVRDFLNDPPAHSAWTIPAGSRCGSAPFQMPTTGFIGFVWGDSFRPGTRHQGIDIFSGSLPGVSPVYAAYDGYLTRLADWKSSLIVRIPADPLQPERQIWTYYTHLADPQGESYISADFPPGTLEKTVKAGTLLGYMGNFSGDPANPVGVHLHFSIVLDDGRGKFRNELEIANTLDPSPYFNLSLNASSNRGDVPLCRQAQP